MLEKIEDQNGITNHSQIFYQRYTIVITESHNCLCIDNFNFV